MDMLCQLNIYFPVGSGDGGLFEGKFSVEFFNLGYEYKHFYEFSTTELLVNFRNFDIIRKNLKFKRL